METCIKIKRQCKFCKQEFEDYPSEHHIYCSEICWRKDKAGIKEHRKCLNCLKEFIEYKNCDKKFCSHKCYQQFFSKNGLRSGEKSPLFGKKGKNWIGKNRKLVHTNLYSSSRKGFREDLNNQFFRSAWEANFARLCNYFGTKWEYEEHKFFLEKIEQFYIPDFYLPEINTFVEITGQETPYKNKKINMFIESFPEYNFIHIIDKDWYKKFSPLKHIIPQWEVT